MASCYSDVSLIIDRYWQQDCIFDNEKKETVIYLKVCLSREKNLVYNEDMLVECSVLCETRRFIYQSKIGKDEGKGLKEIKNLGEFLNEKANKKIEIV